MDWLEKSEREKGEEKDEVDKLIRFRTEYIFPPEHQEWRWEESPAVGDPVNNLPRLAEKEAGGDQERALQQLWCGAHPDEGMP